MGLNKIYLCRHGATAWSKTGQHTGWSDLPLISEGEEEARQLRSILQRLSFQKVYTSPLTRARQTATLAGYPEAILTDALKEWNYGQFEGKTTPEILRKQPGWNLFDQGAPGGESPQIIAHRAQSFIDHLLQEGAENVLVFSSAHVLRVMMVLWLNLPISYGKYFVLSTASFSILGFEYDHRALLQWNQTVL